MERQKCTKEAKRKIEYIYPWWADFYCCIDN